MFLGALGDVAASPVKTHTPLLGAQLDLVPGAMLDLRLAPAYEHGVLLDIGALSVAGRDLAFGDLACFDAGRDSLTLAGGPAGARVVLIGGLPFEEEIVMWWNFVARTHDEIVEARDEWGASSDRFGDVPGYAGAVARIPAPPLPSGRLRSRNGSGRA